ncbi:hypothetical protein EJF36_18505 [Bacillus sp. HMF5848]|uniref:hypothetical protein n=1 Tax=Bacillus sp. HMF5848 TaxID=2495421 RepID=UPI000F77492C|nr:hypothetical protein [Bacillus sp. HMF5848]RSK28701.1 hypothetical protein EJF36_18505 [Bacillus sp. HMF5848]
MKRWHIATIITLVILIGIAGTVYYNLEIKQQEIAEDDTVEAITDTDYNIELPTSTSNEKTGNTEDDEKTEKKIDQEDEQVETETTASDKATTSQNQADSDSEAKNVTKDPVKKQQNSSTDSSSNKENSTSQPSESTNEAKDTEDEVTVTVAEIKSSYMPVFKDLETQANNKVNSLVNRAIAEYKEKKQNGESISFSYFYTKYTDAGEALETKTNQVFNTIYAALEKELVNNGYSKEHAKEFKDAYNKAKKERRNALLRHAINNLK